MASGVDVSKRKPRRTRGTPSYTYRNKFALGVIAVGSLIFAAFFTIPSVRELNDKITQDFMHPSEEELERRALFSFLPQRRAEDILKIMEDKENLSKER